VFSRTRHRADGPELDVSDDEASVDEEAEAARAGLRAGMRGGPELPAAIAASVSLCPQTSLMKKKKKKKLRRTRGHTTTILI